jgi:hypothetical protein
MRIIRLEAPTEQSLRIYLYPFTLEAPADPAGYTTTETSPRQYEATIEDPLLIGIYRVVVEVITESITTIIDSGYVRLDQPDATYVMTNKLPTTPSPQESSEATLPDYGPKRVKTKEMEIEQFDPLRIQIAQDRGRVQQPSWCDGAICVGKEIRP